MLRTASPMAAAALYSRATMAPDDGGASAATPAASAPDPVAVMEFPQFDEGTKFSLNMAELPAEIRMDFLKTKVREYIGNRLNTTAVRFRKDPKVAAWDAYDEATKADALQTTVPKPEGDRPTPPDFQKVYDNAVADLKAGNVRKQGDGEGRRKTVDPLVKTVTDQVVRDVFAARKANDNSYTFLKAKAEVGSDGIKYLNDIIEAKVAAGADRTSLEKSRDERYVNPAKVMLGLTNNKKLNELPSLL